MIQLWLMFGLGIIGGIELQIILRDIFARRAVVRRQQARREQKTLIIEGYTIPTLIDIQNLPAAVKRYRANPNRWYLPIGPYLCYYDELGYLDQVHKLHGGIVWDKKDAKNYSGGNI